MAWPGDESETNSTERGARSRPHLQITLVKRYYTGLWKRLSYWEGPIHKKEIPATQCGEVYFLAAAASGATDFDFNWWVQITLHTANGCISRLAVQLLNQHTYPVYCVIAHAAIIIIKHPHIYRELSSFIFLQAFCPSCTCLCMQRSHTFWDNHEFLAQVMSFSTWVGSSSPQFMPPTVKSLSDCLHLQSMHLYQPLQYWTPLQQLHLNNKNRWN